MKIGKLDIAEAINEEAVLEFEPAMIGSLHEGMLYSGDFLLVHGTSKYSEGLDDAIHIDGRLYEDHNENCINEYLENEAMKTAFFKQEDKDNDISIYRDGREDWYVGYSIKEEDDGEFYINENEELKSKFVEYIKVLVLELKAAGSLANKNEELKENVDVITAIPNWDETDVTKKTNDDSLHRQ